MSLSTRKAVARGSDIDTSDLIHSPFYPEFIRPGDLLSVELAFEGGTLLCESVSVWKLSPLGIELLVGEGAAAGILAGSSVDVKLAYGGHVVEHRGLIVSSVVKSGGGALFGIRWVQDQIDGVVASDRRKSKRWLCGREYMPTGLVANPLRFNDYIHFRIVDVSKQGMQITTSMRNKLLVPGMRLEGLLTFPLVGQASAHFEVVYPKVIQIEGKDYLSLGCKFVSPDHHMSEMIGQYLLQFGPPVTVSELETAGLGPKSLNNAVTFSCVKTEEDYRKVLALRRRAWISTGKFSDSVSDDRFGDQFDARARILVAFYKGEAIASLRIVFTEEGDFLEHEKYLKLPTDLPRPDQMVEVTRVVVDPEFRGKDLLMLLFKQAAIICLQAKRRWILGNSDEKLLGIYERIGFKTLPQSFAIPEFNITATLFLGDVHHAIKGSSVGPIVWNVMYSDLSVFLSRAELIAFDALTKLYLARVDWTRGASKVA